MKINKYAGSSPDGHVKHQRQAAEIISFIDDPDFGVGIVGYNPYLDKRFIYFIDPVPSEAVTKARRRLTFADWRTGITVGKNKYHLVPGNMVLMNNITYKRNAAPAREWTFDDKSVEKLDVLFIQWLTAYENAEAANDENPKTISYLYATLQEGIRSSDGNPFVRASGFPWNELDADGNVENTVINTFTDLKGMFDFVNSDEAQPDSYLVRVVNADGNLLAGGEIIRTYDYNNPERMSRGEFFCMNLARRMGVTKTGLMQAFKHGRFQLIGLMSFAISFLQGDNGEPSLTQQVLKNPALIPRDAGTGRQIEMKAVPCIMRGRENADNGVYWVDKLDVIANSKEIIDADLYSGNPPTLEEGLKRAYITVGEGDDAKTLEDMDDYFEHMGCTTIAYPNNNYDAEFFEANWDDCKKGGGKAPAQSKQEPAKQEPAAEAPAEKPAEQQQKPAQRGGMPRSSGRIFPNKGGKTGNAGGNDGGEAGGGTVGSEDMPAFPDDSLGEPPF